MNTNKIKLLRILLTSFLALGILVSGMPTVSADSAYFNSDPADRATALVSNYTDYPGSNANWSTSVAADANEIISFLIYYHNTSSVTASQTRVRFDLPSGQFTSLSASGRVWANNAAAVVGSVNINLSSSQSLTFIPGSVQWYPNQSQTAQAVPFGQNGSEILTSNGLLIGEIAPGWASQGYVVFRAQISNNQPQNPPQNPQNPVGSAPFVLTNPATNYYQNAATLNGSVNPNNAATTVWFEYGSSQSLGSTTNSQSLGSGNYQTNVSAYVSGLNDNTTYYFRVVAQNSYGTSYGSIMSFVTQSYQYNYQYQYYNYQYNGGYAAPYVITNPVSYYSQNAATLNGSVNPNNSPANVWFEYGTSQSFGSTSGYQSISGSELTNFSAYLSNLNPNSTYYYRAVAQNSYGTSYGSVMSFNSQQFGGNTPVISTQPATFIYRNSALLNGSVNPNNSSDLSNVWFEWGTNYNLSHKTDVQPAGNGINSLNYSFALSGLYSGTTYYYRAAARNSYGIVYGNILSFTTPGGSPVVPVTPTPVVIATSTESTLSLTFSTDNNEPVLGSEVNLTVIYKNIGSEKLNNAVLKIILPPEVDYLSSILPPTSISGKTLVIFNLGNIDSNSQGMLNAKIKLNDAAKAGNTLSPGAVLEYTDAADKPQSVSAYLVLNTRASLASLISIGSLLTNWLFYLLLLIILVAYIIYRRFFKKETAPVEAETNVFARNNLLQR